MIRPALDIVPVRGTSRLGTFVRAHTRSRARPSLPYGSLRANSGVAVGNVNHSSDASTRMPRQHAAFDDLASRLSASQPCFGARGDEVELILSPKAFYAKLLEMIARSRRRILISTLYIGVEEEALIEAIRTALTCTPQLRVTFLLDFNRSTRTSSGVPASTIHAIVPLIEQFGDRVEAWLYRSPKLRGLLEQVVPPRYNEGWGTWHAKYYAVDDEVIISGANLASSYFTNRQDRYIHFRSHPSLLSYLSSLTRLVSTYSYLVTPRTRPGLPRTHVVRLAPGDAAALWPTSSLNPRGFSQHANARLSAFQKSWCASNVERTRRVDADTWFWPVIQAGVLGIREEERALAFVWDAVRNATITGGEGSVDVDMTSGYFGLYQAYKQAVINSPAFVRVITASPKANGFYGSKGLSRLIPEGYTLLQSRFRRDAEAHNRLWGGKDNSGIRLKEWERDGWTYHAKGIWLSPHNGSNPFFTFIGSSNLSTRSLNLDTELSLLLTTSSPTLRRALGEELGALNKYTIDVGPELWTKEDRKVSFLAYALVAMGVEGML